MERGKKYSFHDCGTIKSGTYHSTIEGFCMEEIYHILICDDGENNSFPYVVIDSSMVSKEDSELYEILNDKKLKLTHREMREIAVKIFTWHELYKNK